MYVKSMKHKNLLKFKTYVSEYFLNSAIIRKIGKVSE